jgi:hypothetical protein
VGFDAESLRREQADSDGESGQTLEDGGALSVDAIARDLGEKSPEALENESDDGEGEPEWHKDDSCGRSEGGDLRPDDMVGARGRWAGERLARMGRSP